MKLLFENWRKYNSDPFQLMCEQYDKKLLTEEKLFEHWKQTTLKEFEQLNEINWEKEAELTADADYKSPQDRKSDMLQRGQEKVNDWLLKKSIQLIELAKRNATRAIGSIKWLIEKIDTFCDRFPIVCKVAKWTLVVVAFYIAFAFLFENEAQAKLYRSGKPVSDGVVDAMKGQLVDIIDLRNRDDGADPELYKLLAQIDSLHDSKSPHEFMKSKEKVDKGLRILYDGVKDVWQQTGEQANIPEKDAKELVYRWMDIGERTSAWYREETIKIKGFMSQTLDYGKTIAKKAADAPEEVSKTYFKLRKQRN